jgi:hypothetical protein
MCDKKITEKNPSTQSLISWSICIQVYVSELGPTLALKSDVLTVLYTSSFCLIDWESAITLADVLIFATGASQPPPLGFDSTPALEFTAGKFPMANTCGVTLYIPLLYGEYEEFKDTMEFAIQNSPSFGHAWMTGCNFATFFT